MAKWRVLIVDDSKTAQARLRKMLDRFDLDVDTVLSAEEALGYLSYRQPAVVFLDHHMEGMDGLEALKIIKSNPATALIPVIMYTSEKGDLYVGQARALGAMDILGKEVIKQASLDKVLASLGITPKNISQKASELDTPLDAVRLDSDIPTLETFATTDLTPEAKLAAENLEQVQRQVSRLFEIHIAKVRQEIEDNTKFLLRRLAKESVDRRHGPVTPPRPPDAPPVVTEFVPVPEPENNRVSMTFLGLILICIAFLGYHLYINNRHQEILSVQYGQMISRISSQEELFNRLFAKLTEAPARSEAVVDSSPDRQIFMDALSWAVNVDTQIGFGEQGLNDQRIYMLGELLSLLKTAEFSGVVYLDVHVGNYCVIEDPSGHWILPEPDSNVEDCLFMVDKQPNTSIDGQVSVGFMNYLNNSPLLSSGKIHVEIASQGYAEPRASYPAVTSATSAGEWNKAAQKNHRITVSFSMNSQ